MERKDLVASIKKQGVSEGLLGEVEDFIRDYPTKEDLRYRIPSSYYVYYGKETWEAAIYAILNGDHLLLSGPKATGKNVFSENLAQLFARPMWNVSLNVNSDTASLIGSDTLREGEVVLREGPVTLAAREGGFAVFDEINMAKNESLSVVHSALDYRRIIDIPGYDRVKLDPACRFIGTMNYGYMGTRELNEALVSRFMVLNMPALDKESLKVVLGDISHLKEELTPRFATLFEDLQTKSLQGEISSKAVDLRGLIRAIDLMEAGLNINQALEMGLVNKSFDLFEREIVRDVIRTLFPRDMDPKELFK
ncbi:MAG: AAA family ATPase [Tissierellia bacterium]|nr:AAA family ATPase [Tissierellia bacterium]